MAFPRPSTPAAAWRDLLAFLNEKGRHRFLFALIAIAMPALLVTGFYVDSQPDKPKPQIIYVQSWPEDRSDAEIKKQQKIDQAARDKALAQRQLEYKQLEKRLGI